MKVDRQPVAVAISKISVSTTPYPDELRALARLGAEVLSLFPAGSEVDTDDLVLRNPDATGAWAIEADRLRSVLTARDHETLSEAGARLQIERSEAKHALDRIMRIVDSAGIELHDDPIKRTEVVADRSQAAISVGAALDVFDDGKGPFGERMIEAVKALRTDVAHWRATATDRDGLLTLAHNANQKLADQLAESTKVVERTRALLREEREADAKIVASYESNQARLLNIVHGFRSIVGYDSDNDEELAKRFQSFLDFRTKASELHRMLAALLGLDQTKRDLGEILRAVETLVAGKVSEAESYREASGHDCDSHEPADDVERERDKAQARIYRALLVLSDAELEAADRSGQEYETATRIASSVRTALGVS